jgi:hypothetical protein
VENSANDEQTPGSDPVLRNSAKLPPLSRLQMPMIVAHHLNNSRSRRILWADNTTS